MDRIPAHLDDLITAHAERRMAAIKCDLRVLRAVVNGERYTLLVREGHESDALRMVGRWAGNPELAFTWRAAAAMSEKIGKGVGR